MYPEDMVQMVEHLPRKQEALKSSPIIAKINK
jgi:hypothetical protein